MSYEIGDRVKFKYCGQAVNGIVRKKGRFLGFLWKEYLLEYGEHWDEGYPVHFNYTWIRSGNIITKCS